MNHPSEFFQALYQGVTDGYAEIRLLHNSGDISKAKKIYRPANTIHTGDFDYLAELNEQGYHIYHRVNVSDSPQSRKDNISQIVALWLEIDSNDAGIPEKLETAHFPPTTLIHSGSGYHAYWLLRTPHIVADTMARKEVERTLEGMILDFGTDSGADRHTKDCTRILRTPFFFNVKDKYAPDYPQCRVVWHDDAIGDRYPFAWLHKRFAPLGAPIAPVIRRELPVVQKGEGYPKWIEDYLKMGAPQGERNKRCHDVARGLWDLGYEHLEIVNLVQPRASADGLPDHEISTAIKSATSYPRNPATGLNHQMKARYAMGDKKRKD